MKVEIRFIILNKINRAEPNFNNARKNNLTLV